MSLIVLHLDWDVGTAASDSAVPNDCLVDCLLTKSPGCDVMKICYRLVELGILHIVVVFIFPA